MGLFSVTCYFILAYNLIINFLLYMKHSLYVCANLLLQTQQQFRKEVCFLAGLGGVKALKLG